MKNSNQNKSVFTETVTNNLDLVVQSFYTLIIAIVAFLVVFEIYFKFSLIRRIFWVIFGICRKFFGLFRMAKVTAIRENENEGALSGNGEDKSKKSVSADDYSLNSEKTGALSGSGEVVKSSISADDYPKKKKLKL